MPGYLYLAIAIVMEVIATSSMKALDGFNKPLPLILVVVGYSVSLFLLSLVVKTVPVGVAYALWEGIGIVLITLVSAFFLGEHLSLDKALGLAVPGMPVGSPGMDGPAYNGRKDPYDVLLVTRNVMNSDVSTRVFTSYR